MSAGQCVAEEGAVQTAGDVCGTWQNEGVESLCITSHTWGHKRPSRPSQRGLLSTVQIKQGGRTGHLEALPQIFKICFLSLQLLLGRLSVLLSTVKLELNITQKALELSFLLLSYS